MSHRQQSRAELRAIAERLQDPTVRAVDVAREAGLTWACVSHRLQSAGYTWPHRTTSRADPDILARVLELRAEGRGSTTIAREVGRSRSSVVAMLARYAPGTRRVVTVETLRFLHEGRRNGAAWHVLAHRVRHGRETLRHAYRAGVRPMGAGVVVYAAAGKWVLEIDGAVVATGAGGMDEAVKAAEEAKG